MISVTNSPTLRAHTMLQENISSIKGRLDTARTEAVTGRAADVARAVDGDTAKVNLLSEAVAYAEDRTSVLSFEGSRMSTAQDALGAMRTLSGDTLAALRLPEASSASAGKAVAERTALAGLEDTVSRLNGSFGGRPLFGGDSGAAPLASAEDILTGLRTVIAASPDIGTALTDIQAWFDDPAGGFETAIYRGGTGNAPTVELSKGDRTATSVRADDQALRDLLRGFAVTALAAEAPDAASRATMQETGAAVLAQAEDSVIQLQASLGVREERVATAMADHQAQVSTLSIAYNDLVGVDQAEAATEMQLLETQLEAAYLTTTRMTNLSLLNFLR